MDFLHRLLKPVVESKVVRFLLSATILLNPLALAPQVYMVFTAPSVEGVSIQMWLLFLVVQGAFALDGIRTKNTAVFLSMFLSLLQSATIITVVLTRS